MIYSNLYTTSWSFCILYISVDECIEIDILYGFELCLVQIFQSGLPGLIHLHASSQRFPSCQRFLLSFPFRRSSRRKRQGVGGETPMVHGTVKLDGANPKEVLKNESRNQKFWTQMPLLL